MTVLSAKPSRSVDVVIAAKNESAYIRLCLDSLLNQVSVHYSLVLNVIVVDNGSTDETADIAERRIENVYRKPELSLAEVRNFGVAKGCGEYIAFIDADCTAGPGWIDAAICCLEKGGVGAVGGPCDVPEHATLIERAWVVPPAAGLCVETEELATSSFVTKRDTFQKVGGFDPKLGAGEDTDISLKINEKVGKLVSLGKCKVVHNGYPKTLLEFVRREYWHGLWEARRTLGRSKILFVSYGFVVSLIIVLIISSSSLVAAFVIFLGVLGIPALLILKKIRRGKFQATLVEIGMLMVLQVIYLLTRSFAGINFFSHVIIEKLDRK